MKKKTSKLEDADDDMHFLLSLHPLLKNIGDDYKFITRIEIMNAIRKIQNDIQKAKNFHSNQLSQQHQHQDQNLQSNSRIISLLSPHISEASLSNTEDSEIFYLGETFTNL